MSTKQILINALVAIGLTNLLCGSLAFASGFLYILSAIILSLPVIGTAAIILSFAYRKFKNAAFYTCWGTVFGVVGGFVVVSIVTNFFPYIQANDVFATLIRYGLLISVSTGIGLLPKTMLPSEEVPVVSKATYSKIESHMIFPCSVIVTKAYQRQYHDPVTLKAGDTIPITKKDMWEDNHAWMWYWGENAEGKGGWIPDSYLELEGEYGTAKRDYSAWEMTVAVGDRLTLLEEAAGWYWARNEAGELGWVPMSSV